VIKFWSNSKTQKSPVRDTRGLVAAAPPVKSVCEISLRNAGLAQKSSVERAHLRAMAGKSQGKPPKPVDGAGI
jgi:hypothetical protein